MPRHTSRLSVVASSVGSAVVALACIANLALAALRPYSARGTAAFTGPSTFVGAGNATHLGKYTEVGTLAFTPTDNPGILHVEGTIIYTAANGAELHASASGELNAATGAVHAALTYHGGTGRFANATGSSALTGQLVSPIALVVRVEGSIGY